MPKTPSEKSSRNEHPIDSATLAWMESQLRDTKQSIEQRLAGERDFVKSVLGLAAKICGASVILIFGVVGFVGYKDISSIDDKINKLVSEKISEKSNEFKNIYEKGIQGLADQAAITAYQIQFSAPPKRFERRVIAPAHIQRFAELLVDKHSNSKILDSLFELLSDTRRDEQPQIIDNALIQVASGKGDFGWIKDDPERLAKVISLLRDRGNKQQPALIRSYLTDQAVPPVVRESAILYVERIRDREALPIILATAGDGREPPNRSTLFALVSLDPSGPWTGNWLASLASKPSDKDQWEAYRDRIMLSARVASLVIESSGRRSNAGLSFRGVEPDVVKFSASVLKRVLELSTSIAISRDSFSEATKDAFQIVIRFADTGTGYVINPADLMMGADGAVMTRVCRDILAGSDGNNGLLEILRKTVSVDRFSRLDYTLNVRVANAAFIDANVDGVVTRIQNATAELSRSTIDAKDVLTVVWRTNDGLTKRGAVTSWGDLEALRFGFQVRRSEQD